MNAPDAVIIGPVRNSYPDDYYTRSYCDSFRVRRTTSGPYRRIAPAYRIWTEDTWYDFNPPKFAGAFRLIRHWR